MKRYYEENGNYWYEDTLIKFASDDKNIISSGEWSGVKSFESKKLYWKINNLFDFLIHYGKVKDADLNYPIILTPGGGIADGMHRIAKAILEGKKTIKYKQLKEMPRHDFKKD